MLKVLQLRLTLKGSLHGLRVPARQEHAPIRSTQRVVLPLLEVLVVVQPLVHLLAEVDLHLLPQASVNRVVLERGEEGEGERDDWAAIAERMGWA